MTVSLHHPFPIQIKEARNSRMDLSVYYISSFDRAGNTASFVEMIFHFEIAFDNSLGGPLWLFTGKIAGDGCLEFAGS